MNLYVESSAIVSWLLGQSRGTEVVEQLDGADNVVSSELLLLECDRAVIRVESSGQVPAAESARVRGDLARASSYWTLLRMGDEVLERARRPFPQEPVRSLDALHLATLILGRSIFADLELLSFDDRIRANAAALGFAIAGS
ncbi:MAG TPA: type II toxin-antitoxin system VapC family toxin [Gemmatimonadota bacterium]|nr:type II toxin-antitoxin system VapC family toxin [Gemmatimonadota bacterium]